MDPHITTVGGGSHHWVAMLVVDFVNSTSLHDAETVDVVAGEPGPEEQLIVD